MPEPDLVFDKKHEIFIGILRKWLLYDIIF